MAYDAARKRVVLFGGTVEGNARAGDTWEWNGQNWTQMADTGPSPRSEVAMAYDIDRQRTVLFGGFPLSGDTWEWDGEFWTQISDTGPAARGEHTMAYHRERNRIVLFGGRGNMASGQLHLNDTWEWDGQEWIELEDTGPSPRYSHAMAYDDARQCITVFGGLVAVPGAPTSSTIIGDTWEWTAGLWTRQAHIGPGPMSASAMACAGSRTILFGGQGGYGRHRNTWEWDGRRWTQREDIGPSPRPGHRMVYDSDRQRLVLFGGHTFTSDMRGILYGDTWELAERPRR